MKFWWNSDEISLKFSKIWTKFSKILQNLCKILASFSLKFWVQSGAKEWKSCRSRKIWKNALTLRALVAARSAALLAEGGWVRPSARPPDIFCSLPPPFFFVHLHRHSAGLRRKNHKQFKTWKKKYKISHKNAASWGGHSERRMYIEFCIRPFFLFGAWKFSSFHTLWLV